MNKLPIASNWKKHCEQRRTSQGKPCDANKHETRDNDTDEKNMEANELSSRKRTKQGLDKYSTTTIVCQQCGLYCRWTAVASSTNCPCAPGAELTKFLDRCKCCAKSSNCI